MGLGGKGRGCHTSSIDLVEGRATAFHAQASVCSTCHVEHQGRAARISRMEDGLVQADVAWTAAGCNLLPSSAMC
jgi:hypothetical protein